MTDQRSVSSVNLFSSSASSPTPASNKLGAADMNPSQTGIFSQELHRASQRTDSYSEPSGARKDASREAAQHNDNRASESSRSAQSEAASQRSQASDRRSGSSADQSHASTEPGHSADQLVGGPGNNAKGSASHESPSSTDSGDDAAALMDTSANQEDSDASVADQAGLAEAYTNALEGMQNEASDKGINSTVEQSDNSAVTPKAGNGFTPAEDQLTEGIASHLQEQQLSTAQARGKLSSDRAASGISTAAGNGAHVLADSVSLTRLEPANDSSTNDGKTSARHLATAEPLSPAELAKRQELLLKISGTDTRPGVGTVTSELDTQKVALETPLARTAGAGTATSAVPGMQSGLPASNLAMADERLVTQALPPVVTTGEKEGLQIARQVVQSEMQLQTDAQEKLRAREIVQQSTAAVLVQARQLAQQQAQRVLSSAVSSDNSAQMPDNTFHSLAGGIVTAPVLQRSDVGNTQAINAPVNMPILQQDADKAMATNIRWMVNEGVKSAMVNVTPSGMGPISVSIGMENELMTVSIVALQGSTREALDLMLPRLREQLAAQGHNSVNVDISDGRPEQSDRGYGQQFSDGQGDTSSSSNSTGAYSNATGREDNDSAQKQFDSSPEHGLLTLHNDGQIKGSYDVYV